MEFEKRGVPVIVHLWRFHTGHHLDGKRRQHRQNGKVMPQYRNYYWNRYSRAKRAAIRNAWFFSAILAVCGIWRFRRLTEYIIAAIVPFILWWVSRKLLKVFTTVTSTTSSDGVQETYRHLRPRYYRMVQRLRSRRFKLSPPTSDTLPAEFQRPTLAAIAEDGGDPVTSLRRPLGIDELLASEAKPKSARPRGYKNSNKRRSG